MNYMYIADIFNMKEEDTNGKRYNLRNADFVLPPFKTVSYGKHSLRTTTVVKIKERRREILEL